MKLYVWNDPYDVSYGGATAYAIAETEDAARAIVLEGQIAHFGKYLARDRPNFRELNRPADRVHDLPYAEIFEWSE